MAAVAPMSRKVEQGQSDDRTNHPRRDRIDELTASWYAAVDRLDRRYRIIAWRQTATSVAVVGLVLFGIASRRHTDQQAVRNTAALCALRHDLQVRVQTSREFLIRHPHGIRDIPAKVIRDGMVGQERTIRALQVVKCNG